mmetsp:Transcript_8023/g.29659  ORF Transcript_8023/g.29659 Transcript_8023/m.29659 type:complete len:98 (-) Transcript_8023:1534-1827(-)
MAKGAAPSQVGQGGAPRGAPRTAAPVVGATGAYKKRPVARSGGTGVTTGGNNMLRFYTDDAPGLKITPLVVLGMSLGFIGFVTVLHVIGKIYSYSSS